MTDADGGPTPAGPTTAATPDDTGIGPLDSDDWHVPPVASGWVTIVSGRDFAISDGAGDMIRGAVHGLLHSDRRYLNEWALTVSGYELHPLAATSPTPFSAVFVARLHELGGRPTSLLLVRRRWVGQGMRELFEVHNSGDAAVRLELNVTAGSDFGHLFDVKAGLTGDDNGRVEALPQGLRIRASDAAKPFATELTTDPAPASISVQGWRWRLRVADRSMTTARVDVQPHGDEAAAAALRSEPAVDALAHHRLATWRNRAGSIVSSDPRLTVAVRRSLDDLSSLRIFDVGHPDRVVVAAGAPWFMTLFGRDSLITGYMALPFAPELARGVLRELADLQGRVDDPVSGEAPGKILHELRSRGGGGPFDERSRYYGTVDATPLYVMLAAEAARWGAVGPADHEWLLPAVDAALGWLSDRGDTDGDGFVDYAPHDPRGLTNQGWMDSWDGVNFLDGTLPTPPIALVEVQGYVDAALRGASELYRDAGRDADADTCVARADAVRAGFDLHFWDDRGWYVQALDGRGQRVDSLGSNPGHALWTGTASTEKAHRYLDAVWSEQLWSGWGVRTLAPAMRAYDPLSYHNGSVWPHDTAICAAGAARYERWDVVDHITDGLLDAASHQGGRLPELFSGVARDVVPVPVSYPGSCSPQAWAAAAVLLLVRANLGLHADTRAGTVTLSPRGRIARDILCERLVVGGRELTIRVRDGEVHAEADGFDVLTV